MLSSSNGFGYRAPDNVASGDYTITAELGHECGGAVQPFVLGDSLGMPAGRFVLLRAPVSAGGILNYAGATVTPPSNRTLIGVSRENVNYSGVTYDCIVAALA
jgi:hypothetical protein